MRIPQRIRTGAALLAVCGMSAGGPVAVAAAHAAGSGGVGLGGSTPVAGPRQGLVTSTRSHPVVAGDVAKIIHGLAYAPAMAPLAIKRAIWAGDQIRHKPYIYGGGHGSFKAAGYDCSGSVSYVLHAAGLLKTPMDSSDLLSWGHHGPGSWITVYTNPGHAFIEIAGIRLDTSSEGDPHAASGSGPRWRPLLQDTSGYTARHAYGF